MRATAGEFDLVAKRIDAYVETSRHHEEERLLDDALLKGDYHRVDRDDYRFSSSYLLKG